MQKQPIYAQQTACFNIKTRLNITQKAMNRHAKVVLLQCERRQIAIQMHTAAVTETHKTLDIKILCTTYKKMHYFIKISNL